MGKPDPVEAEAAPSASGQPSLSSSFVDIDSAGYMGNGVGDNYQQNDARGRHPNPSAFPGQKSVTDAYILAIALGFFGAHHFYLRRPGFGAMYLFTLGLLGVGYVVDLFRIPCLVREANDNMYDLRKRRTKSLCDAYIMWLPLGLFGIHQFYLGRKGWGVLYMCTLGLFGIGWVVDGVRMKWLVEQANADILQQDDLEEKSTLTAYLLAVCPITGLLGGHHYYLGRVGFGLLYTFTCGLFTLGWITDLCRLPYIVKRVNLERRYGNCGLKYLGDAYALLTFGGLFGFHHFYLGRPVWGILYTFTLGLFGIGYIVDFFRLPSLVQEYNDRLEERSRLRDHVTGTSTAPPRGGTGGSPNGGPAPATGYGGPYFSYQGNTYMTYPDERGPCPYSLTSPQAGPSSYVHGVGMAPPPYEAIPGSEYLQGQAASAPPMHTKDGV